ncbi:MAG: TolC family protein [bacterium]
MLPRRIASSHHFIPSSTISGVANSAQSSFPVRGYQQLLAPASATIIGLLLLGAQPSWQTARAQWSGTGSYADTTRVVRIDTVLDLPTIVSRALAYHPATTQSGQGVRTALSEVRVSRGSYLPSLTATSSALRSDIVSAPTPGAPSANSYAAGLASSIEVFTGGRRSADRDRSDADLHAAEATDVSQRYQVTLIAERAFYETLRGADLITVAQARVSRAEQGLRYAQDRVRAGTATRSDELRARLELTTGRQQLVAARDTLQTAAFALGRLVGANGPVGGLRPATLEPRALTLSDSEIVRLAIASAPTVQAAQAGARATEAATRAAKTQYVPDVRLTGGYAWANQTALIGATRPGWQLALGTSFPLFNGFLREDVVTRSEAQAEISRVVSSDATRFVRAESARLLSGLSYAQQSIMLASEAVAAAREDLRVQTERYRAGIATSLDQLTSELAVTQAELALVAARYNYQVTRATLEALVGRPL